MVFEVTRRIVFFFSFHFVDLGFLYLFLIMVRSWMYFIAWGFLDCISITSCHGYCIFFSFHFFLGS